MSSKFIINKNIISDITVCPKISEGDVSSDVPPFSRSPPNVPQDLSITTVESVTPSTSKKIGNYFWGYY